MARERCERLMRNSGRGVLATLHPDRGVDTVPVCFVVDGDRVAVPLDAVKPKGPSVLQRVRNLEADPRASLLCDHWDPGDWSGLWWVRASLVHTGAGADEQGRLGARLARKYPQYRGQPFTGLLVFGITDLTGWSASPDRTPPG